MLRRATPSDAHSFAQVITEAQASWTWAGDGLERYETDSLATSWESRLSQIDTVAWCWIVKDMVVGVVAAGPEHASLEPSSEVTTSAHLSTLFVLPEAHGTGAAQQLHDALLGDLVELGYTSVRLWVPEGAARARSFYARNGWAATGGATTFAGLDRLELRRQLGG